MLECPRLGAIHSIAGLTPRTSGENRMSTYIRVPLALAFALAAGACQNDDAAGDWALATDSALNADLELAGQDTAAQPQLTDVPAGQAPSTGRPATKAPSRPATKAP